MINFRVSQINTLILNDTKAIKTQLNFQGNSYLSAPGRWKNVGTPKQITPVPYPPESESSNHIASKTEKLL